MLLSVTFFHVTSHLDLTLKTVRRRSGPPTASQSDSDPSGLCPAASWAALAVAILSFLSFLFSLRTALLILRFSAFVVSSPSFFKRWFSYRNQALDASGSCFHSSLEYRFRLSPCGRGGISFPGRVTDSRAATRRKSTPARQTGVGNSLWLQSLLGTHQSL
jgi:hypothetical protein